MKRLIYLTCGLAALVDAGTARSRDNPYSSDFIEALRLPPLTIQQDRFQIYESTAAEGLLPNLSNNRPDEFSLLPLVNSNPQSDPLSLGSLGKGAEREVGQIKVRQEATLPLTTVKTKLDVPDAWDQGSPYAKQSWKADEQVRLFLPELETVFLFGQVKSSGDLNKQAETDFTGKTGVGVKFTPLPATELQLRTGRQLSITDFSAKAAADNSQFLMEVLAKMPVPVPLLEGVNLQLEYTGSALAAQSYATRETFKQDLRIILPVGKLNELYIGAKHKSDSSNTPWIDRGELYFGLTIKH